jgi:hypothetical protein
MKNCNHGSNEAMLGSTTILSIIVVSTFFRESGASSRFLGEALPLPPVTANMVPPATAMPSSRLTGAPSLAAPSPSLQPTFGFNDALKEKAKEMLKEGTECIGCAEKTIVITVPATGTNSSLPAPPKAGDLVKHVKTQLASDHQTLGKVSEALMAIQTEVATTEESMLGKVLDLQTARSFFHAASGDRHSK